MRALGLPAKHALFTFLSVDMLRLYAFVTMWAVQDAPFLRIENTRILLKLMRQTSVVLIPKVSSFCSLTLKTNMSLLELRRLWLIELRDGALFADGNLVSFNLERFLEAFLEAVRSNVRICLGTWQICHFLSVPNDCNKNRGITTCHAPTMLLLSHVPAFVALGRDKSQGSLVLGSYLVGALQPLDSTLPSWSIIYIHIYFLGMIVWLDPWESHERGSKRSRSLGETWVMKPNTKAGIAGDAINELRAK